MSEKVRKDENGITKMEANKDECGGASRGVLEDYHVKTVSQYLI